MDCEIFSSLLENVISIFANYMQETKFALNEPSTTLQCLDLDFFLKKYIENHIL